MNHSPLETIAAAGNTEVPTYLAIIALGFEISKIHEAKSDSDNEIWIAENSEFHFQAPGILELLGLIAMRQSRGQNWRAQDQEIEDFIAKFYPTQ